MKKFKVGDRVKFIDKESAGGTLFNRLATIVTIDRVDGLISIEFDEKSSWLHNCEGDTEYEKGWYARPCEIELFNLKANDKVIDIYSNRPVTVIKIDKDNMVFVSDDSYHTYWADIKDLDEYKEPIYPSIYIHRVGCGRTIKACYMIDGKVIRKAKATCHKEEPYFDYEIGSKLALERLFHKLEDSDIGYVEYTKNDTIKVGDKVVVTDSGMEYPTYYAWFMDKEPMELGMRYAYKESIPTNKEYIVQAIAPHGDTNDILCAISEISDFNDGRIYLISIDGIKRCN